MRIRLALLVTVVLLGMALVLGTATAGTKVLRIQTSQLAGYATLKYQIDKWVPVLKEMSGGQLEVQLLPIDAVVPYKDSLDATSKGILDGVFAVLQHFSGLDAGYALMSDPIAAFDTPEQNQMFCEFGGGVQLVQEMHNKYFPGVHVVLCGPYAREALVASKPIRKVEDFKGVKIRAPEGLAAEVFRRAGATPVTLPPSEVYTSLEKKIIDAADMSAYENNDSSGLHKIAKFPIYPGIHSQPVQHLAFNQKVWDSLTPAQRAMLDVWGHAMLVSMTRFADMQDRRVVARDKAGQGVPGIEIINWPQEERDKLRRIAEGAWKDFVKRSPFAQKVYEVHVAFFKRMGML